MINGSFYIGTKNDLYVSTEVIGANFKNVTSLNVKSSRIIFPGLITPTTIIELYYCVVLTFQ